MARTKLSIPEHLKDTIAKTIYQLEQGHAVTLTPQEDGSIDIVYASTNQLVINAPEPIKADRARHQCFSVGDRVAMSSKYTDVSTQCVVKRVEGKRIICSPLDLWGRCDWSKELLFELQQLVIIQSFQDFLLHGLDLSTVSEEWSQLHTSRQVTQELEERLIQAKAEEALLIRKRIKASQK